MRITNAQRQRIYKRAGRLCEQCGSAGDWRGLAIHHIKPKGIGGTKKVYADEELILLCGRCHSEIHGLHEV